MNFHRETELQNLLAQLDDFKMQREQQMYFIKESFLNGEYLINPKLIASHLLSHCFLLKKEYCLAE